MSRRGGEEAGFDPGTQDPRRTSAMLVEPETGDTDYRRGLIRFSSENAMRAKPSEASMIRRPDGSTNYHTGVRKIPGINA